MRRIQLDYLRNMRDRLRTYSRTLPEQDEAVRLPLDRAFLDIALAIKILEGGTK